MDTSKLIHASHEFGPVYDKESGILILGSFPSVKSREQKFYYAHPQNRFWKVLAAETETKVPESTSEKRQFLLRHHIAVWDVIEECDIIGSSDSSIRNVVPTDLTKILSKAPIRKIFVNGRKAEILFHKYQEKEIHRTCTALPSTSPANAVWTLEKLIKKWSVIREYL